METRRKFNREFKLEAVKMVQERGVAVSQAFALVRAHKLAGILIMIQGNPEFEAASAGHPKPGYRDFIKQLREETQAFAGQVVLVHGDAHVSRSTSPCSIRIAGNW